MFVWQEGALLHRTPRYGPGFAFYYLIRESTILINRDILTGGSLENSAVEKFK